MTLSFKDPDSQATCLVVRIPPGVATGGPGACLVGARGYVRLG
jgi:hypothetical protein